MTSRISAVVLLCCSLFNPSNLYTQQDSIPLFLNGSLRISGGLYYQSTDTDYLLDQPDYIKHGVYHPETQTWNQYKYAQDNPLYHGATYFDIDAKFEVLPGFRVNANLITEHRGMSYGVYDTQNMIVYPKIHASVDTAVTNGGDRIELHASIGNITNGRLYEGLTFYNLDWQGSNFWIKWKYFKIEYHKIGDLVSWIGLGMDDADDWIFSAEGVPLIGDWKTDIRYGFYSYPVTHTSSNINWLFDPYISDGNTVSIGVYPSDEFRIYAQYGLRNKKTEALFGLEPENQSLADRSAYVVGAGIDTEIERLTISTRGEYRHYGQTYNAGYVDRRDGERYYRSGRTSTIGNYLYPISFFTRPFSQWAVFTDYENQSVSGITLQLNAQYLLPYDIVLYADLDANQLMPEVDSDFLWLFYNLGVGWSPRRGMMLRWTYSNKGMNLDRHFPTFYKYKDPAMNLTFEWDFNAFRW